MQYHSLRPQFLLNRQIIGSNTNGRKSERTTSKKFIDHIDVSPSDAHTTDDVIVEAQSPPHPRSLLFSDRGLLLSLFIY